MEFALAHALPALPAFHSSRNSVQKDVAADHQAWNNLGALRRNVL